MERFSPSMMLIMSIFKASELGSVAGLGHHELTHPPQRDANTRSQEESAIHHNPLKFVAFMGIQDSKELNKTCCLNRGTCTLGSSCACPPYFYGWNWEHDFCHENYRSAPHDTWLPKKCAMCKCWQDWFCCFAQTFLPGCGNHVTDKHLMASRTPELMPSACTTLMLASWHLPFYTVLLLNIWLFLEIHV
ncbi:protein Cripto-like [Dugong dugon]